ncbi:MAG: diguanylate cyclase [Pseudolabrys sp.]
MMIATGFAAISLPCSRAFFKEAADYRLRLPAGKAEALWSAARIGYSDMSAEGAEARLDAAQGGGGRAYRARASDVAGRLGGDEFGVLMWNVSPAQAAVRARKLENRIEWLSVAPGPARLAVGASAGVAPLSPERDADATIEAADQAMYARKRERRW